MLTPEQKLNLMSLSTSRQIRMQTIIICCLVLVAALFNPNPVMAAESDTPPPLKPADNFHITIPRGALGREYLMSMSLIPQSLAATSRGLSGKIVQFELYHDAVDLYETSEGMVVTKDLPSRLLLASFPIVATDNTSIVIDFNRGMRRVFGQGNRRRGAGKPCFRCVR